MLDAAVGFFLENTPSLRSVLVAGPPGFAWAMACLGLAGWLKRYRGWRTGYTRKVFHFLVFTTVAVIQWRWGTPMVCLFGGMTTGVIFLAILAGPGNLLYEAMAREKDEPHRTHYIVIPYLATLVGGLAANIMFGPVAVVGYLVTGLGDAVGEPVGTRFGRHTYRVPSLTSVKAVRSWEGSVAVFLMCAIAILVATLVCPELRPGPRSFLSVPLLAAVCALTEAVSPHGWDNLTMQWVPTALAAVML